MEKSEIRQVLKAFCECCETKGCESKKHCDRYKKFKKLIDGERKKTAYWASYHCSYLRYDVYSKKWEKQSFYGGIELTCKKNDIDKEVEKDADEFLSKNNIRAKDIEITTSVHKL